MTDEEIVKRVLSGSIGDFSLLVDRYKDKTYSMCYRYTCNAEEAKDLSQDIFIHCYSHLHSFGGASKFSTWFYRLSTNKALDWIRKNEKKVQEIDDEKLIYVKNTEAGPEESCIIREQKMIVQTTINQLSEKYRTVIVLYHYQNLNTREISEILDVPIKTVETRLLRAKEKIKNSLLSSKTYGGAFIYGM